MKDTRRTDAITISLVGNFLSAQGGNHLNADLTRDGQPDITIASAFAFISTVVRSIFTFYRINVAAQVNGVNANAFSYGEVALLV